MLRNQIAPISAGLQVLGRVIRAKADSGALAVWLDSTTTATIIGTREQIVLAREVLDIVQRDVHVDTGVARLFLPMGGRLGT